MMGGVCKCIMLILIAVAHSKLSSDVAVQVDLTADGEHLYILQLCISLYAHCDSHS